ncbi:peptidoglycan-binding domain-containing protein [Geomonas paludis]|uniref:peptidoglycan-binding domain-containing protein n=1 Tax=Geomonas paludis TaxID=2740185 RepID=UPI0024A69630|nr:peptidoglycan-binding domain-containing protein [Geomonas paludis]
MATGQDLLRLAETRIHEKYVNVLVPKDNPNWHGPWDCAEFASWAVYQQVGKLYGCVDNSENPATADAYSGAWVRDAQDGSLIACDQSTANTTAGVILIRKPPLAGKMGHVAISDGCGGTVEAAGTGLGVRRGKIEGRLWHYCVKIPDITYSSTGAAIAPKPLPFLVTPECTNTEVVKEVQRALNDKGFDPCDIDGIYGPHTVAAVFAFQKCNRLVADGIVGPVTAKKLSITLPA